ncbi:MAG: patatin-like phospholipase family protein, partial [Cyclobacteriaceae bacterium]
MLFAIVTGGFGKVLGIPYLFLDPEYTNEVGFWSFFIVGLTIGGFIMAFHITGYIVDSHRFSFLGTLSRPFSRFAVNNSVIPVIFLVVYITSIIRFQIDNEFNTGWQILWQVVGILGGLLCMITFLIIYLRLTNKDIFKYIATNVDRQLKKAPISRANVLQRLDVAKKRSVRVDYYIDIGFHFRKVKSGDSYDKEAVLKVFDQNHLNLVLIELIIFFIILLLGIFRESTIFQIPAAASSVLILTIFIMFTGAASYWFRGWSISVVILMLVVLNLLIRNELITSEYQAYGLDYKTEAAEYSLEKLKTFNQQELYRKDQELTIDILNNWKQKFDTASKPKMVFMCNSGGGQRSALWSVKTMQAADSAT